MDEPTTSKPNRQMTDQKVFDVSHPGRTVPSSNARPAIMTHAALPRIPVVSTDDKNSLGDTISVTEQEVISEPNVIKEQSLKNHIEPLSRAEDIIGTQTDGEVVKDSEADLENKELTSNTDLATSNTTSVPIKKHTSLTLGVPTTKQDTSAAKETTESDDDLDEINEYAGQAAAKRAKKSEDEQELKRIESARALIESKNYVVPIRHTHGHRVLLVIGVLLLVAASACVVVYTYLFYAR
jgi:hypothetical protein